MVFPQSVSVDCVPWRVCKPVEDCLFFYIQGCGARPGNMTRATTVRGQRYSRTCFNTGSTWLFTGSVWWRNAVYVWIQSLMTTFPDSWVFNNRGDIPQISVTQMMESLNFLWARFSFQILVRLYCRNCQQVASQLWLNESTDLRKDFLHYLLYSQFMCFLFIIRFYIKLLISEMLMKCADVCLYCCFDDWMNSGSPLVLLFLLCKTELRTSASASISRERAHLY